MTPTVCRNARGTYYAIVAADKQPWAAILTPSQDREKPNREWLRVRHARDEEANFAKIDVAKCWVVMVPDRLPCIVEAGALDNTAYAKGRIYLDLAETGAKVITRDAALDRVLGKVELQKMAIVDESSAETSESKEGVFPF